MPRLSQTPEEREAKLREYETALDHEEDYASSREERLDDALAAKPRHKSGGITVGQIAGGVVALILLVVFGPKLLGLATGLIFLILGWIIKIGIIGGIAYLLSRWLFGKKRRY